MAKPQAVRLAVSNSAAAPAWAAYDAAMLELQGMYLDPARTGDTPALRRARITKAQQAARLWEAWRHLYLADGVRR